MVEEIERVAAMNKRPRRSPFWHRPARWALLAALKRRGSVKAWR
jgi:hypothetical protein